MAPAVGGRLGCLGGRRASWLPVSPLCGRLSAGAVSVLPGAGWGFLNCLPRAVLVSGRLVSLSPPEPHAPHT